MGFCDFLIEQSGVIGLKQSGLAVRGIPGGRGGHSRGTEDGEGLALYGLHCGRRGFRQMISPSDAGDACGF